MSLSGLRDMSLIETPPSDRLAIQTQGRSIIDAVIKSAIDLELARGGQVFFIHNRVESIGRSRRWSSVWCHRHAWQSGTAR